MKVALLALALGAAILLISCVQRDADILNQQKVIDTYTFMLEHQIPVSSDLQNQVDAILASARARASINVKQ